MKDERLQPRLIILGLLMFLWGELVPWTWFTAAGLLLASMVWILRGWKPPHRFWTSTAAILAGFMIYIPAGSFIGRDASAALLGILAGLKALESKDRSDERTVHLLGLFFVSLLFLFRSDLIGFLVGVGATAFFLVGVIRHQISNPQASLSRRWTWRLSLQALPFALILFFIAPRIQNEGLWNLVPKTTTGFHEGLDPASGNHLEEDFTPVLRATFHPRPPHEAIFWRGAVLEHTTGFAWTSGGGSNRRHDLFKDSDVQPSSSTSTVEWVLEDQSGRWVFAPDGARHVRDRDGKRAVEENSTGGFWKWLSPPGERTSLIAAFDPNQIRKGQETHELLELPALGPTFQNWILELSKVGPRRSAKVDALLSRFQNEGFVYTHDPGKILSMGDFLKVKKGFCEHYASAATLMLRALGVPARIVVGYLGGEWNPIGGFQVVTKADAHSWTEWLDEDGVWRTLDVTAVVHPFDPIRDRRLRSVESDVNRASWVEKMRWNLEAANYRFALFILGFDIDQQKDLWLKLRDSGLSSVVAFAVVLFALLAAIRSWRPRRRNAEAKEVKKYRQWLERGIAKDWPVSWTKGPLENLMQAKKIAPKEIQSSEAIVQAYLKVRYQN